PSACLSIQLDEVHSAGRTQQFALASAKEPRPSPEIGTFGRCDIRILMSRGRINDQVKLIAYNIFDRDQPAVLSKIRKI
ncbi:MAG TPA: hypothetical protein VLZ89_14685, partial [Anaerolineales bacterium]|nr:hypothetical protein [Anaerolineales bacterium]